MGSICCDGKDRIVSAIPYQVARRRTQAVASDSSVVFDKLFKSGLFVKIGDYHSHPYQYFEKLDRLRPSETDLLELKIGDLEVIVQVRRIKRKSNYWRLSLDGSISIAWNRFRFMIAAFRRIDGYDKLGIPRYKKVRFILY